MIESTAQPPTTRTATRDTATRETAAWDTAARDTAARETAARETAARETAARDTAARETAARETAARETAARDTAARETAATRPGGQPGVRREVVSFVRRSTRMRPRQARAWERLRHTYVLDVPRRASSTSVAPGHRLDLVEVFGRRAPLVVEIGSGTGEALVAMAARLPDCDVLAFEVYLPGIARTVARLHDDGVGNVRLVQADAVQGLTGLLGRDSISELWTFFPDPWPKARHHKRRLVDRAFADLVVSRLRAGGSWRLATDWADYAERIRGVLDAHPDLENAAATPDGWAERFPDRPLTRFEQRGIDAGRDVRDLHYRRR